MKNIKKLLPMLVVCILVLSGLGAVAITNEKMNIKNIIENNENSEINTLAIPLLSIEDFETEYVEVSLEGSSTYLMNPGKPMLPSIEKSVELPFGARNINVEVELKAVHVHQVKKAVRPAPPPILEAVNVGNTVVEFVEDEETYGSVEIFPSNSYKYHVGCGLNTADERVTHVAIHIYPVRYAPALDELYVAESAEIEITYEEQPGSNPFPEESIYDMVIIAPPEFASDLQKLIDHKNNFCDPPINTTIKITNEIYNEYSGQDKPEKIKYFIKDAIEQWGIKYVLLVGGLKSLIYGNPREHQNYGSRDWRVPVRYTNNWDNPKFPLRGGYPANASDIIQDPGVICDLYYADIYREGGVFEDWDPNDDGIFAAWNHPDPTIEDDIDPFIDLFPDVYIGRLACRNTREVKIMVNKIINYEKNAFGASWFDRMVVISGDGFLDQEDLDIQWDVNDLDTGEYTIYAVSKNPEGVEGPVDELTVTVDLNAPTNLTFNHDDHLKTGLEYPSIPVAEIVSPSDGDVLGKDDYWEEMGEGKAFCNNFSGWANIEYKDGIMHIRGKSYDPKPYGNVTDLYVWIENSDGVTVFEDWRNGTEMYYEGEWVTGEKELNGRGGALSYMNESFERKILWASSGELTGPKDVITTLSKGSGFTFFSGHGNPQIWGDHFPGVPGSRREGSVDGLLTVDLRPGYPYFPFPMELISNFNKPFVVVVGGCHNSQFNVSLIPAMQDKRNEKKMWCYGQPLMETWSWWLTRLNKRGAIASIGNTGLGYGYLGKDCTIVGLDGGICIEFFYKYGQEGIDIIGQNHGQTITKYVGTFDITNHPEGHTKTVQQWVLLGDPSLKIGGYGEEENQNPSPQSQDQIIYVNEYNVDIDNSPGASIALQTSALESANSYAWDLDEDGVFDDATGENIEKQWDLPGVYWVSVKATYPDKETVSHTVVEIAKDQLPNMPTKPVGPENVEIGETYTYTTSAVDPYGDELYYLFDWGDDTIDVVGPCVSGEEVSASHIWTGNADCLKANYEIKVKVFDSYGQESKLSEPLLISASKGSQSQSIQQSSTPLFFQILQRLANIR